MPNLKILIAEDSEFSQLVVENTIETLGFDYKTVANGSEAISALLSEAFDLILMDIEMPVLDGLTATKQIRNLPDNKNSIPIFALTAHQNKDYQDKISEAGFTTSLPKPFTEEQLKAAIDKFVLHQNKTKPTQTGAKEVPSDKLYNLETLQNFGANDSAFVENMVTLFVKDTPEVVKRISSHIKKNDYDNISQEVHLFLPRLNFMGIDKAVEIANRLNKECHNGSEKEIVNSIINELELCCDEVVLQLKNEFDIQE